METEKIIKKGAWFTVYGLTTYGTIKSDKIAVQIGLGFLSAYAFNEILK